MNKSNDQESTYSELSSPVVYIVKRFEHRVNGRTEFAFLYESWTVSTDGFLYRVYNVDNEHGPNFERPTGKEDGMRFQDIIINDPTVVDFYWAKFQYPYVSSLPGFDHEDPSIPYMLGMTMNVDDLDESSIRKTIENKNIIGPLQVVFLKEDMELRYEIAK